MRRYHSIVMDSARWEDFEFRPDDIVISTPPKCGTTWMQRICALLVFQETELDRPLSAISPWLDMLTEKREVVFADLDAQEHRRFVKTHTPFDGLPYDARVTYVCVGRDPRDAGFSFDNHMGNMDIDAFLAARAEAVGLDDLAEVMPDGPPPPPSEDPLERFWGWVDTPDDGRAGIGTLEALLHHLATFWEARHLPNVALFHYADLKADLEGEMRRLAGILGIDVPEERWPVLVEAATFEHMKERASSMAPNAERGIWKDNARFFDQARHGSWREFLDENGLRRYEERATALASPELLAWAHEGARVLGEFATS
ncbi:MAG TPA: sulfotransferase domain-containing protein [Acidimicrobiia bacterium]|nr:sulfotransferase domain-containing protein [Acidimicrobiia bacterium]